MFSALGLLGTWFDVAVDDADRVDVADSFEDGSHYSGSLLICKLFTALPPFLDKLLCMTKSVPKVPCYTNSIFRDIKVLVSPNS